MRRRIGILSGLLLCIACAAPRVDAQAVGMEATNVIFIDRSAVDAKFEFELKKALDVVRRTGLQARHGRVEVMSVSGKQEGLWRVLKTRGGVLVSRTDTSDRLAAFSSEHDPGKGIPITQDLWTAVSEVALLGFGYPDRSVVRLAVQCPNGECKTPLTTYLGEPNCLALWQQIDKYPWQSPCVLPKRAKAYVWKLRRPDGQTINTKVFTDDAGSVRCIKTLPFDSDETEPTCPARRDASNRGSSQ